jgi:hypothetical protein
MYENCIILYLYEAQHVSGNTPSIIKSLKLHWQPLVFYTWKVVGREVGGICQAHGAYRRSLQWLNHRSDRQPQTYLNQRLQLQFLSSR